MTMHVDVVISPNPWDGMELNESFDLVGSDWISITRCFLFNIRLIFDGMSLFEIG